MSSEKRNFIHGNNSNNNPSLTGRGTTTVKRDYFSEQGSSKNGENNTSQNRNNNKNK